MPFILQILQVKNKTTKLKGASMCSMLINDLKLLLCWNCVIGTSQNKRRQNNFAREAANFYGSQIKWFLYYLFTPA